MSAISEIAPDLFRLSIYVPDYDMQFNHFLVRDEEPLLFHAGLKGMFPALREAVASLIDPSTLRHIAWSHFESDEDGGLNEWPQLAPRAQPVCTLIGKLASVDDFAIRSAFGMTADDVLETGDSCYPFHRSPHIPHGWDATCCSRKRARRFSAPTSSITSLMPRRSPLPILSSRRSGLCVKFNKVRSQADLQPETLAVMHGSSYRGQCEQLLNELAGVIKEEFDKE